MSVDGNVTLRDEVGKSNNSLAIMFDVVGGKERPNATDTT